MKLNSLIVSLSVLLIQSQFVAAQENSIKPLKPGDKVPNLYLGEVLNSPLKKAHVADFKGKLLILDFWDAWCVVCIAEFPRMYELQKKFGDKLVILPVGFDALEAGSIRKFVEKRKGTQKEMKLPTTIQTQKDTLLNVLFPHMCVPFEVWIDDKGYLLAMTDSEAVTAENIQAILNGEKLNLPVYKRTKVMDNCSPFLVKRKAANSIHSNYGSVITGYNDSINYFSYEGLNCDSSGFCIKRVNYLLPDLYAFAYQQVFPNSWDREHKQFLGDTRIIFESFDKPYLSGTQLESILPRNIWEKYKLFAENLFCYELVLPVSYSLQEACKYMIDDLDRYFKINSKIEKRKVKCLALIRTGKEDKLSANPANKDKDADYDYHTTRIYNVPMNILRGQLLALLRQQYIIYDETGYTKNIDFEMSLPQNYEFKDVLAGLQKYGLDLVEQERELNVLILSPKN